MHIRGKHVWLKHGDFMLIDLLSLICAFIISYRIKFGNYEFWKVSVWPTLLSILILLNLLISFFVNPYSGIFKRPYYEEIIRSILLGVYNFLCACVLFYVFKVGTLFSRVMLVSMYILYVLFAIIAKYIWKKLLLSRKITVYNTKQIPLFLLGTKENIDVIMHNCLAGEFRLYKIEGICLINGAPDCKEIDGIPIINDINAVTDFIFAKNIQEVLVSINPALLPKDFYKKLIDNGIGLHFNVESIVGVETENQFVTNIGVYKTLSLGMYTFSPAQMFYLTFKRLFDLLCGLIGVIILIPITIVIKLIYLLSGDTGSIFYTQERIGKYGKKIRIIKYRTMVKNADELLKELLKDDKIREEWERDQKLSNDPRITKAGKFLRKTSIDEFPQFINVFLGSMSLVGPRPLVDGELEAHDGLKLYEQVKPGITGWWGCNGRSNIDYRERLELEYYYVKNCSLYLDLLCIFRTVLAVIKKDGAH